MEQNSAGPFSKSVFKGSVLVSTLMENYPRTFRERFEAARFAQKLIDIGHIRSNESNVMLFNDSAHLYQWCDPSLLEDARKLARNNMTKCNITEKKLSELIDTELDNEVANLTRTLEQPKPVYEKPDQNQKDERENRKNEALQEISSDQIVWKRNDGKDDAIDNKPVDLDSIDLQRIQKENEILRSSVTESLKRSSLSVRADQDDCYSDNEKQLLEDVKRMQQEHQNVVTTYESRINELMGKMNELKNIAELLEKSSNQKSQQQQQQPTENMSDRRQEKQITGDVEIKEKVTNASSEPVLGMMESVPVSSVPPSPPVPPPPAPTHLIAKPNKHPVKPKKQMRTLFWSRILLKKDQEQQKKTLWHELKEPDINTDEFESTKAISDSNKQSISLAESMTKRKSWCKTEGAKILNEKRSRVVSIRMKSMHCDIKDIENAIYNLDFTKCSVEILQGLNEIRGTTEEIKEIRKYLDSNSAQPLDEAEKFLFEISKFKHFAERLDCIAFKETFVEVMFTTDQQINLITDATSALKDSVNLRYLLEIVLACGNYMNGGTARGQADGFNLDILNKIKDVKGGNNVNLLNYIIRMYIAKHESEDAGKNGTQFKLPDPAVLRQAGYVSFLNIDKELTRMRSQLVLHRKLVGAVVRESDDKRKQPFQNQMTEFLMTADDRLVEMQTKVNNGHKKFKDLLDYLAIDIAKTSSEGFFSTWAVFLEDCRRFWRAEQRRIARDNFERVDSRRKAKLSAVRPASVDRLKNENTTSERQRKPSLKQRFSQIKTENETKKAPTKEFQPVRSETPLSVCSVDSTRDNENDRSQKNSNLPVDNGIVSGQDNRVARKRVVTARPVSLNESIPINLQRRVERPERKSINDIESKINEVNKTENGQSNDSINHTRQTNGGAPELRENKWFENHANIENRNLVKSRHTKAVEHKLDDELEMDSTTQATQTRRASMLPEKRSSAAQTERRRTISGTHRSLKQLAASYNDISDNEISAFKPVTQRSPDQSERAHMQQNEASTPEPPLVPPLPIHVLESMENKTGSSESLDQLVGQTGGRPRDRTPLTPSSKTASANIENYINLTIRRKESLAKTRAAFENVVAKKPEIRSQSNLPQDRQNDRVSKQAARFEKRGEDKPPPLPPRAAFSEKLQQFVALKSKYQLHRNQRRGTIDLGSTQSLPGAVQRNENGDAELTKYNNMVDYQSDSTTPRKNRTTNKPPALDIHHRPQIRTQKYDSESGNKGANITRKLSAKLVRSPVLTNPPELDSSLDSSRSYSPKLSQNPTVDDAAPVYRSTASLSMKSSDNEMTENEGSSTPRQNDYQNTIRRVSLQHSTMFHSIINPNTPTDKV